ncbi:hypothetical protein JXA32_13480 [Candidatus Sumerlaeota bacterium]|nr:hypothetical protein [Candidatus Sumerlaeota bacterium]
MRRWDRKLRLGLCLVLIAGATALSSGCASLSLFTTKHDHVHNHEPCNDCISRVERVEHRVNALESRNAAPQSEI